MWKGAWRLGRESGSKSTNHRTETQKDNSKSNNKNSTVEGDDIKVTLNLQNIFAVEKDSEKVASGNTQSLSRSDVQSDTNSSPRPLSATINSQRGAVPTKSTATLFQPTASNVDVREVLQASTSRPENSAGRRLSSTETVGQSLYSVSEYPVPKPITSENIRKHLPKDTDEYIQAYMSCSELLGSNAMVPLWKPSPSDKSDARKWRHHVYVGDVGIFNAEGGFDTLFNIFNSKIRNRDGGYEPPSDFVPYPRSLEEMSSDFFDFQRSTLPGAKGVKVVRFAAVSKSHSKQSHSRATNSYQANSSNCSAICLRTGFLKVSLKGWERPRVLEYIRDHQDSWQRHVEETAGTHFRDRPLLVICATWRTQSYALATGSRPWPQKCQGIITLQESVEGGHTNYQWEVAGDNRIFTQFGPSIQLKENQESYFATIDKTENPKYSAAARKEIEECHSVAIAVVGLRKRGWIRGGSVKSGRSSKTTIRPLWARMSSLPTHLDSSIQEEVEF
ncbi:hypothetical protein BJ912DRAFT_645006 [Pholiota molesta]|nr:hypothetical protein BJ912DRAFT_645006 [Pholiota molesta]